jgi:hypothetical protein
LKLFSQGWQGGKYLLTINHAQGSSTGGIEERFIISPISKKRPALRREGTDIISCAKDVGNNLCEYVMSKKKIRCGEA